MTNHKKGAYETPETDLLEIHLEVNFTDSTPLPGMGIEDGSLFDDYNFQIW